MVKFTAEHTPNSGSKPKLAYDATFTDRVIAATGPHANARLAEVMPALVRHLHGFAREVGLTVGDWSAAVDFVSLLPLSPYSLFPFSSHRIVLSLGERGSELTVADQRSRPTVRQQTQRNAANMRRPGPRVPRRRNFLEKRPNPHRNPRPLLPAECLHPTPRLLHRRPEPSTHAFPDAFLRPRPLLHRDPCSRGDAGYLAYGAEWDV